MDVSCEQALSYQIRFAPTFRKSLSQAPADDQYKEVLPEVYIELAEQPFKNPKLQTHQLKGAPRNTFTTDVGGRQSDRRIAWRLVNRTIVLLLYGTHAIQGRACRMSLEIDDSTDTLNVHEPAMDGGSEPTFAPRRALQGRCFRMWTDPELSEMGFASDAVQKLRAANTDEDVEQLEAILGARVVNLYLYQHVDGEEAAKRQRELMLVPDPAQPESDPSDVALEAAVLSPQAADDFLALSADVAEQVLDKPIEDWMVYVHPEQLALTHRTFDGPAMIHGPSGTGKTVVALHRAAYLARAGKKVLFTSFLSSLPPIQGELFSRLAPASADSVIFQHVQSLARELLSSSGVLVRAKPKLAAAAFDKALSAVSVLEPTLKRRIPRRYLVEEIDSVIKPRFISSVDAYVALERVGRPSTIDSADRRLIWNLYETYESELAKAGAADYNDVLAAALELLNEGNHQPDFDCVIVDEAQDLSVLELRFLHALVGDRPDGLLLVGDGQQSLYAGGMRLEEAGISVEGRSVLLSTNYRNTEEIIASAFPLVATLPFEDGTDPSSDGARDFTAIRKGQPPLLEGFRTTEAHDEFVVGELTKLLERSPGHVGDIAILVSTNRLVRQYIELLAESGFEATDLRNYDGRTLNKIKIGTYQRSKGLDFKNVFLPRLDDASLVTPYLDHDVTSGERWAMLRREIFVAMGRARDTLTSTWVGAPSKVLVESGLVAPAQEFHAVESALVEREPPRPNSVQSDSVGDELVRPDSVESGRGEPGPGDRELVHLDLVESDPVQLDVVQSGLVAPELAPLESVPATALQSDLGQPAPAEISDTRAIPVAQKYSRLIPGGWGTSGAPLLPVCLRGRLQLDPDLLVELQVESGLDLGLSYWQDRDINAVPEAILKALADALPNDWAALPHDRVAIWPSVGDAMSLPLRTRTQNRVRETVSSRGCEGSAFTIQDLSGIGSFGSKSLLDLLCVLEGQIADHVLGINLAEDAVEFAPDLDLLAEVQDAFWSGLVTPQDPRFSEYLSIEFPNARELARHLLTQASADAPKFTLADRDTYEKLVRLPDFVASQMSRPFDEALAAFLLGLIRTSEKNTPGVLARFGFGQEGPATLDAAGKIVGVTREAIRQLCKRAEDFIDDAAVWLPTIEEAQRLLIESAPLSETAASELLVSSGLSSEPVSAPTFIRWLEIAGIEAELEFNGGVIDRIGKAEARSDTVTILTGLARPFGFVNIEAACEELSLQQVPDSEAEMVAAVVGSDGWRLNEGWLWLATTGPTSMHPVINMARKVRVSAGRPFRPADLRHALSRRAAFLISSHGRDVQVPTTAAIENFCRSHPELTVDENFRVDVDLPADIAEVLSETELVLKQAVDASPGRVISRSELLRQCVAAGIKEATANQYLVYGPIAASPEVNSWTTVGQAFDVSEADFQPVERKRTTECEWEGEDTVVLRSLLKGTSSVVVYFPVAFHPYVADKKFGAFDIAERDVGIVAVGENGQSWGYGPFLRRSGAETGDLLVVTLSLDSGTAVLRLEQAAEAPTELDEPIQPTPPQIAEASTEPGPANELTKTPKLEGDALAAMKHRGTHMQIIAAAGSGKTEVVSQRVTDLLAEGVSPESIVAFTFTERAATELKERVETRVEDRLGRAALDRLNGLFIGTIHAYCFRLLQQHVPKYETYDVLDQNQLTAFLSREAKHLGIRDLTADGRLFHSINLFLNSVGVVENELLDPTSLPEPFATVVAKYTDALERYRLLSYGQQIQQAVFALESAGIAGVVAGSLQHLIVDEYQDVNPAQERLIELLGSQGAELCVVGDDDQAIYQWRGSDVQNIVTFADRYAPVTSYSIVTNRRSVPAIVDTANRFARSIPNRLPKSMDASREADDAAKSVALWSAADEEREAGWIANTVLDLADEGVPYREMAVLIRGRSAAKRILDVFSAFEIPVQSGGRTGLFDQAEARLLGQTYCWLSDIDWRDPYSPGETIGSQNLVGSYQAIFDLDDAHTTKIKRLLQQWKVDARSKSKPADLVGEFYQLLEGLGIRSWDTDDPHSINRLGTLARFTSLLADYESVRRRARPDAGVAGEQVGGQDRGDWYYKNLAIHIVNYAQGAYDGFEGEQTHSVDAVDLVTVHGSKGLEWPVVFVPSMTKSRFPTTRTGREQEWLVPRADFNAARYEGSDADERRLFYVAMTRSRDWLSVSRHRRVTTRAVGPSPYWEELSEHLVEPAKIAVPEITPRSNQPDEQLIISFSDLASFLECGHAYRLRSMVGFQPRLAPELGYGKAVHHVLRQVAERTKAGGTVPSPADLAQILDESFFLPTANKPAHRQMKQAAERLIQRYITDHQDDLHRVWETERPFELHLDGVTIFGRADVILDQEGGSPTGLAIVDYKTSTDSAADHALQLQIYADAGIREGLEMKGAFVHDLGDTAQPRTRIEISAQDINAAELTVTEASERILASDFQPSPGDRCRRCEVRSICASRQ